MRFSVSTVLACATLTPMINALMTEDKIHLVPRKDEIKSDYNIMCAPKPVPADMKCNGSAITQELCAKQCWCSYGVKDNSGMVCEGLAKKKGDGCHAAGLLSVCYCRSKPDTDHCDGKWWVNIGNRGTPPDKDDPAYNCPKDDKDEKGCVKRRGGGRA